MREAHGPFRSAERGQRLLSCVQGKGSVALARLRGLCLLARSKDALSYSLGHQALYCVLQSPDTRPNCPAARNVVLQLLSESLLHLREL